MQTVTKKTEKKKQSLKNEKCPCEILVIIEIYVVSNSLKDI